MTETRTETNERKNPRAWIRLLFCLLVLAAGAAAMAGLSSMKKPPAEAKIEEIPLQVAVQSAAFEDVPVNIRGFGETRSLTAVDISPEVSGRITQIHPRLDAGEIIPKGELLFAVDDRNYRAALDEADARIAQWEASVARLKKSSSVDKKRLSTLQRNRSLTRSEFNRLKKLYEKSKVGTRSGVDKAEQAYNSARDQADLLAQTVEIYPIRIREAQASLASAEAMKETAQANLERCRVSAPFTGRVKSVSIEAGQYAAPGQKALTLADDSMLEILVPIDSQDARAWLQFDTETPPNNASDQSQTHPSDPSAWFAGLKQVDCTIKWTEAPEAAGWKGTLHRVVRFDAQTRTVTLAVRIPAEKARPRSGLPLVEGMFCEVSIPGRPLHQVIRLPRWAVSFENTVYLSVNQRLKTVPVQVARISGENAFISEGISPGDRVVVSRLVDPLENALLSPQKAKENPS